MAQASTEAIVFTIPAGPLTDALNDFARTANLSLSFDPSLVQGKQSRGLHGIYTPDLGFHELLQGTELVATPEGPGGYILRAGPPRIAAPPVLTTATMAQVDVQGSPPDDDYSVAMESLVTGTATPLKEIPQSVHVIPAQVIRDQQPQTLFDVLRNIPGANSNPVTYGFGVDAYDLRGYGSRLLLDGLAPQFTFRFPLAAIDRIEVLKGMDSAVLGDTAHGGVVNVVLKHPQRDPVHEVTVRTGSQGHFGISFDLGDTLAANSHVQYRLIASADKADGNTGGYRDLRDVFLSPSVAWDDGTTRAEAGFQYSRGRLPARPFTVLLDDHAAPISGAIANKDDHTDYEQVRPYFEFSRKLNSDWTFHAAASLSSQSNTTYDYFVGAANSQGYAYYQSYREHYFQRDSVVDSHLQGKFTTGAVAHELTTGTAYYASVTQVTAAFGDFTVDNIFDPQAPFPSSDPAVDPNDRSPTKIYDLRTYAQDYMTLHQRWHLMTGIALNQTHQASVPSERIWTPKLGLTYDASDLVSVYGSYIRGFSNQPALLQNGGVAPPIRSKTTEAGVKLNWPDKPLDLTLAVFRTSQNISIESVTPGSSFYQIVGGGESKGVEFSLQGQPAPGWQAIASYTYTDFMPAAGQVNAAPRHMASLWTTYFFRDPILSNWGIGAGIYTQSAYAGNGESQGLDNFIIPGQTRTDLSLYYRKDHINVTLGVQNLFDRTLYAGHAAASSIYLNPGRTVMLTTAYRF